MSKKVDEINVPNSPEDWDVIPDEKMMEMWTQLDPAKKDYIYNNMEFLVNSQEFGENVTEFLDTSAKRLKGLFGRTKEEA